jgi:hypothetical protein
MVRQGIINILIGQMALFASETQQVPDFFGQIDARFGGHVAERFLGFRRRILCGRRMRIFLAPMRLIGFTVFDDSRITFLGFFHRPFRACFPHVFPQPVKCSRLLRQTNTERALHWKHTSFSPDQSNKKIL